MTATAENPVSPAEYDAKCQWALAPWWRTADLPSHYPVTDLETLAELMQGNEYDCDKDLILRYLEDGVIPTPERREGRLIWTAPDILALTVALEARRRWKKFSKLHGHKKNRFETLNDLAGADGCFVDLKDWDVAGLLALLNEPGCELGARQAIAVAIRQKLKSMGVDV